MTTSSSAASTSTITTVIDNPCWGSPTHCSLGDLLQHYSRSKSILYESSHYIVLNKPPDLRMNGPYPATVYKLLCYWYPPPSIVGEADLLSKVSQLHTHLKDNELRPCHQLDYATSGVLLVARSREAAAAATESFASRCAQKEYLAIVQGHLRVNKNLPLLEKECLQILQDQETLYRQGKAKKRKDTFVGFIPTHAMFYKWQAHYNKQDDVEKSNSKRPRREMAIDLDQLWKQAIGDNDMNADELNQLASSSWKDVKNNPRWKQLLQCLATLYNNTLRSRNEQQAITNIPDLPTLFRIQGEPEHSFYIFAPLAQVKDEFCMRIQTSSSTTDNDLDYKAALTRCIVLQHGTTPTGHKITKVRLEPKTGRRHQLRLHMVVAGHAIVGDATYNNNSDTPTTYPRMCLHAHSLSLPVLDKIQLYVMAPDPFIIRENGELLLQ